MIAIPVEPPPDPEVPEDETIEVPTPIADPFSFVRHVSIRSNNEFNTNKDASIKINELYSNHGEVTEEYLLIEHGEKEYTVDLNRIVVNENIDITLSIQELLEWMTEEVLYTYTLPDFDNFENRLAALSYGDFANKMTVTASNREMEKDSPLLNDPGFLDVAIGVENLNLNYMLPMIDGLLYRPFWSNWRIFVQGAAKTLMNNPEISLLVTSKNTEVQIVDILSAEAVIPSIPGFHPMLVLDGVLQVDPHASLDIRRGEIRLSKRSRDRIDVLSTEMYDPLYKTFLIFFEGSRVIRKTISWTYVTPTITEFSFINRQVLVFDDSGKLYPNVTTSYKTFNGEKRNYCYSEIANPKLMSLILL